MTTASWLITPAPLGLMFGYWFALPEHIRDRAWPMHARFHILQAFFGLIESSIIERGCLSRPVGDVPALHQRVEALVAERNTQHRTIHWQFTAQEARIKLHGLSPNLQTNGD